MPQDKPLVYEELLNTRVHPDDRSKLDDNLKKGVITGRYDCSYRILQDGGPAMHVRACSNNYSNPDGSVSMVSEQLYALRVHACERYA